MEGNLFSLLLLMICMKNCDAVRKNVLFIIVDDLRPALHCYKDKIAFTPNIDKLAEDSVQFNQAYAQQALCAPSRNSLLTSRRPDSLYLYDFYSYWRLAAGNFTTLPQHFKENGYTTASFGKVFHPGISSNWSDDSPYSWSIPPYHPSTQDYKDSAVCMDYGTGRLQSNLVCPVEPEFQPGGTLPDIETLKATRKFLKNYNANGRNKSFFAAVGFHKPHIPFKFPRDFLDYYPLEKVGKPIPEDIPPTLPSIAWNPWVDVRKRDDVIALNVTFPYGPMPAHFAQRIRQSYYAAVTYIDDLIGKLMNTMKNLNLLRNTIIVLIGDHGWSLGEHAEWAKYSNFEVALQVPFLIYDPELTNKASCSKQKFQNTSLISEHLVELVDIFPTLCELTGLPVPPMCDLIPSSRKLCTEGESLVPIIKGSTTYKGKSGVFSQYPRPSQHISHASDTPHLSQIRFMGYSIRTKRYRYTEWVGFQDLTPKWEEVAGVEMYDHFIDPVESINLAGRKELEDVQTQLRRQLRAGWRDSRSQ